jgi:hypothetical protein
MSIAFRSFGLSMRARVPAVLRHAFRLAASVRTPLPSGTIPAELLTNCRVCASRVDLLDHLPQSAIVAELGTFKGDFARHILQRTSPAELHLIDLNESTVARDVLADRRVTYHNGDTANVICSFPDAYFDWVYIDAGHTFEACQRDAIACEPKIKPCGYMAFNDFAHIDPFLGRYGVHRAVIKFATDHQWPFWFLALQEFGLYDIVIRKPARRT